MRSPALVALVATTLVSYTGFSGTADAKPRKRGKTSAAGKSASPCGAGTLPLSEGNQWTYSTVAAPLPATPQIARISPALPKGFVITVKSVTRQGEDTVVTLEEKITYDRTKDVKKPNVEERIVTSTITCNDKKFDISPESFFFAGEPGGYTGITVDNIERKGTSWKLTKGAIGDTEWPEDLVVTWTRNATEGSGATFAGGKLELERRFIPQDAETVATTSASYTADKLAITTTGRITLDKPLTANLPPMELPANWISQLWIVNGTGVVQSLNSYAHMYQLVDVQLK